MGYLIFVLLLALPVVELYLLIKLGGAFGLLPTLATMVGISLVGAWMLRRQGLAALHKANAAVQAGQMPIDSVVDGFALAIAAALLMTPGFVTDLAGLVLLIPPVRAVLARALFNRLMRQPGVAWQTNHQPRRRPEPPGNGPVIDGEFTRIDEDELTTDAKSDDARKSPWKG